MPRSWPLSGGKPSTWNRGDGYSAEDVVKVLVPACKKSDSQTQEGISIMTLNYKTTLDERRRRLRQLIQQKGFVRNADGEHTDGTVTTTGSGGAI